MWPSNGYEPLSPSSPPPSTSPLRTRTITRARALGIAAGAATLMCMASLYHVSDTTRISEMLRPTSAPCNPYDQPGMLVYDKDDVHANRWHPFAGMREDDSTSLNHTSPSPKVEDACTQPAPALAASFLRASWAAVPPSKEPSIGTEWAKAPLGPDGREWEDVEWARNRTIVHVGDSISRFKSKYICEMAGEEFIELNWAHPWAPPEIYKNGTQAEADDSEEELDPFGWHHVDPGDGGHHTGHYCYVPGLDFLVIDLHTYGLDEDEYWINRGTYIPPYSFEDRVQMLAGAYVDRVRATTGRTTMAPEVVYVNSGMWDVMRFAKIDLDAGESVDTSLGPKRLAWYRRRVRDALTVVGRQFPDAALFWSATHYPIRPSNGWFFGGNKGKTRPEVKLIRLAELHAAAVSAFEDRQDAPAEDKKLLSEVQLNRWGLAMIGQEGHQVDDLHPTLLPGGYLWADMALYDLRSEVRRRGL